MSPRTASPPNARDALTARFAADLDAAIGRPLVSGETLALAVSGGPDSMALLALAAAAFPNRVIAATVDHQLRTAAADEAQMVADHCARITVPHATLTPDQPIFGASMQARAREARYALLTRWAVGAGATVLLTAHHADDQAETLLMRLSRASGPSGLAAIRRARPLGEGLTLCRPLLGWRRDELRAIVEDADIPFVDDPSNVDPAYDRTRARVLLNDTPWLDAASLAASAAHLAEVEDTLAAVARLLWRERAALDGVDVRIDVTALPRDLARRLARLAIDHVRNAGGIAEPAWSHGTAIEPLLDSLQAGRGATQAGVFATVRGGNWHFRPAPPRRSL